jgi:large repetitive protein
VLTWPAVTGVAGGGASVPVTGYVVEWDAGGSAWATHLTTASTGATSAGLTAGTLYSYRVAAINKLGTGPFSPALAAYAAQAPEAPAAPATSLETIYVKIAWAAPTDNFDAITAYQVLIADGAGDFAERTSVCDGSQPATVSALSCLVPMTALWAAPFSLAQGAPLLATVRALNGRGWSAMSPANPPAALVETVPHAPAAPTRGVGTTDTAIQVDWPALSGLGEGGSPVLGYALYSDAGSGQASWVELAGYTATLTATTFTQTGSGVVGGATYYFKVMAKNKWGWSAFSSPSAPVLAATSPGQVPSTSTAIDAATGGVRISWAAPAALGGVPVLSYLIEIQGSGSTWRTDAACDGTTSPVLSGRTCLIPMASLVAAGAHALAFDALVVVRVSAANVRGFGPASSPNTTGARVRQAPAAMSAPTKGATTSDSQVEVLWSAVTAPGLPTGNSPVLSYQLLWDNGQPARTDFLLLVETTSPGYTLVGVTEGTTYRFRIRAVNIYGPGPASAPASIRASDIPSRMDPPSTARVATDIVVSWSAPAANGAALAAYEISVYSQATSAYVVDATQCDGSDSGVFSARQCIWPIAYLRSTYAYPVGALVLFAVRARNDEGWGALSNPNAGGATIQTVPVAMGAPVEGSATSDTQIELTWAALASVSSSGGATITSYALEWDEGSGTGNFVVLRGEPSADTTTAYLLTTGVTAGAPYVFRLRASNALGWGAYSPTTTVTPSSVPAAMAAPTTAASSVYAQVSWAPPDDNGAAVTAYRVLIRKGDGGLTEDLTYCDGADPAVRAAGYCLIPMAALRAAPYSLAAGALVAAQVQAANLKGWGELSPLNTAGAAVETEPVAPAAPARVEALTDDHQVTVSWPALTTDAERGGPSATVTSYELQWVAGASGGTWATQSGVSPLATTTTRTASPVLAGQVYRFRVRAKNKYGWGPLGPATAVYAGDVPEAPAAPTTTQAALDVVIAWVPPDANGLAIDAYEVLVLESDGATWTAAAGCDGTEPTVVAAASCAVPMATLRASPFALVLNDPVIAKVRAHNLLGWSLAYSPPTVTGATIKTEPGAPPTAPTEGPGTDDT